MLSLDPFPDEVEGIVSAVGGMPLRQCLLDIRGGREQTPVLLWESHGRTLSGSAQHAAELTVVPVIQ